MFPHVADTLGALQAKGLPLGLVTNKPTPFVAPLLEALRLLPNTLAWLSAAMMCKTKNRIRTRCYWWLSGWELPHNRCCFVGDSRNDIQAAKAAGCPSVGLTYGYNYGEAIDLSQPGV